MNGKCFVQHNKKEKSFQPIIIILIIVFCFVTGVQAQTAYRLIGIIESSNFTGAVIDDSAGSQLFYRLRERLPDGSQIVRVKSDSILLKRSDGTSYELFIIHDTKPSSQHARPPVNASPPVNIGNTAPEALPERLPVNEKQAPPASANTANPSAGPAPNSVVQGTKVEQRKYRAGSRSRSRQSSRNRGPARRPGSGVQ